MSSDVVHIQILLLVNTKADKNILVLIIQTIYKYLKGYEKI